MARVGFLGIFLVIGLTLGVTGTWGAYWAIASSGWPTTQGTVLDSGVGHASTGRGASSPTTYAPSVAYEYSVEGETYTSDRIYFAGIKWSSDIRYAEEIARQYPPGETVPVAYHPARPDRSVLLPGARRETWFTFLLSVAFTAFGAGGIWLTRDG